MATQLFGMLLSGAVDSKHLGTSAWVGRGEVTFHNVLENSQNIVVSLVYLERGKKPHYTGKT